MNRQQRSGDPVLTNEIPWFERAQAGCRESLDHLMRRHDGLVQAVVRQQVLGDLPFLEILQAGRTGLWRAILGFDPHRGLACAGYLTHPPEFPQGIGQCRPNRLSCWSNRIPPWSRQQNDQSHHSPL